MSYNDVFTLRRSDVEEIIEYAKVEILKGLIEDGIMTSKDADTWCSQHIVLLRQQNIFQKIFNWKKSENENIGYVILVKRKYKSDDKEQK